MTNDSSILPPLKNEKKQLVTVLSDPMKNPTSLFNLIYTSQTSPSHLLRETKSLLNRLEKTEKNIKELRSNVPRNITNMLDNLEASLKNIKDNSTSIINNYDPKIQSSFDISEQLEKLEYELRNDIKTKFSDFNQLIRNKVDHISTNVQKANSKQENQLEKHSKNIDTFLNDIQKKENDRIDDLEMKLNKLKKYSQPIENILSYSEPINANSIQIKELQRKLSLISSEVDNKFRPNNQDPGSFFITSSNTATEKSDENSVIKHDCYDPQDSLEDIINDINSFKESFNNALLSSYKKIQDCENKIMEVEQISNGLRSSIQILENKLAAEEMLIQEVLDQMDILDQKTMDKGEYMSLKVLGEQIKSTSSYMNNIILSLKSKVLKCELSVPLIKIE